MAINIKEYAEVLHAEHHPGTFVPALDECPEHSREEFEAMIQGVTDRLAEFHFWCSSGTNQIRLRHDPCGGSSEPVFRATEAAEYMDTHICSKEA